MFITIPQLGLIPSIEPASHTAAAAAAATSITEFHHHLATIAGLHHRASAVDRHHHAPTANATRRLATTVEIHLALLAADVLLPHCRAPSADNHQHRAELLAAKLFRQARAGAIGRSIEGASTRSGHLASDAEALHRRACASDLSMARWQ
ncbi:hypothetical protein ACP70R_032248 [Stipagrostis hirtigluma subsp. patula]